MDGCGSPSRSSIICGDRQRIYQTQQVHDFLNTDTLMLPD